MPCTENFRRQLPQRDSSSSCGLKITKILQHVHVRLMVCVCVSVYLSAIVTKTHERLDQSTPNLTHICVFVAGRSAYFLELMTSLITPPG